MANRIDRAIEEVTAAVDRVLAKYVTGRWHTAPEGVGHLQARVMDESGLSTDRAIPDLKVIQR